MKGYYGEKTDGYRLSFGAELGLFLIGFVLPVVGVFIDWAIGRRKKMMECSAEAIYLGLMGTCTWYALWCIAMIFLGCPRVMPLWALWVTGIIDVLLGVMSWMWVRGMRYKMTPEEKATPLHGDDWIKPGEKHLRYDAGVTIEATPEKIWPYIRQNGQDRAGWYSFDYFERMATFDIHNHYDVHPEWQELKPGTYQWFHQAPLSIGEWVTAASNDGPWYFAAHSDTATDPTYDNPGPNQEKALKLPWMKRFCWTWNWEVRAIDDTKSRLVWRCDCTFDKYSRLNKYIVVFVLGTCSVFMGRGYMDCMKKLCEGRLRYGENKR